MTPGDPVVIDCISALDTDFAELFRETLRAIDLDLPVLIVLKRARVSDARGLAAVVATVSERRLAGGHVALMTASSRWRSLLRQCGIPEGWIVVGGDAPACRRIILARASHTTVPARPILRYTENAS